MNDKAGKVLIDQVTTIDKLKRVGKFVGQLDERTIIKVERAICYVLALSSEALTEELAERRKKAFS